MVDRRSKGERLRAGDGEVREENRAEVAPRFFGLSAREAQELVAELMPRPAPPLRDVMTSVTRAAPSLRLELPLLSAPLPAASETRPTNTDSSSLLTSEVAPTHPARVAPKRDEFEPLTADLTRLHFNVLRPVVKKLEAARRGLGHAIPNATLEQVLEAALDLLLEKQARARGQVKRPRTTLATQSHAPAPTTSATSTQTLAEEEAEPLHRRTGPREAIPAAVRRAVWARDAGRCTWPLDSGGVCGSTHRLELDHLLPSAKGGEPTVANLRVVCRRHNALAARQVFGRRVVERYARGGGG